MNYKFLALLQNALPIVILYFLAFFWGSVPYSVIVSNLKGINIMEVGSKNAGATNVYRSLGIKFAVIVFVLDFLKGFLACLTAQLLFNDPVITTVAGSMAILGHTFSPFLGFKGGKGAAAGLGVLLYISPLFLIVVAPIAYAIIKLTRYVSVATITCSILVIILSYIPLFGLPKPYIIFINVIAIYIILKHKSNVQRLIQGTEKKV